jgi:hypothetical protein
MCAALVKEFNSLHSVCMLQVHAGSPASSPCYARD